MKQEITINEAIALIESTATILQKDILRELKAFGDNNIKVICYSGDTSLPELIVGEAVVIVNGNLNVTTIISDCDGVDSSLLIVLGNVNCKNVITLSAMYITGNLQVAHTLLGDSLNDYVTHVGGDLEVRTIIEGGHWIKVQGEASFQYLYHSHCDAVDKNGTLQPNLADNDLMEDFENNPDEYVGRSYVPILEEVLDEDGYYDLPKAIAFIRNGGEWFCAPPEAAAN
jgi:hypothetical protein